MLTRCRSHDLALISGVPQRSVLSPVLYTLYTNDLPPTGHGWFDTLYADDISQVITTPSKSKNVMKLKAEREIERINKFKRTWKIKTSEGKSNIIPIAQYKIRQLATNGKNINTSTEGKFLGLKLQARGIAGHSTEKKN